MSWRPRRSLVEADPMRLQQVIWNLLQNAVKFTPAGGTITIRSSCPISLDGNERITLEVSDTGVGIAPDLLGRIFDPFEQGDPEQSFRTRGLGLGLAISRSLAEAHGGRLIAWSEGPGRGATFSLELPLAAPTSLTTREVPTAPDMPTVPVPARPPTPTPPMPTPQPPPCGSCWSRTIATLCVVCQ